MLCRNFQRIPTSYYHGRHIIIASCTSSNHQSLFQQQTNTITTHCIGNSLVYQHGLHATRDINMYHHQQRDITIKTFVGGAFFVYMVKKFVGIKLIQYIGWKKIYRLNHRRSRIMMMDQPQNKKDKSKKMMKYYSKFARKTYDFFQRHPKFIENWLFIDRIVTNTTLYIPRKLKLGLHRWLSGQMELQKEKNKSNPILRYPKKWYGPLMLDLNSMIGYTNIIILSQYVLINLHENHLLFDAVFIMSNFSNILKENEKIQKRWKENPQEWERQQYVNLFKMN